MVTGQSMANHFTVEFQLYTQKVNLHSSALRVEVASASIHFPSPNGPQVLVNNDSLRIGFAI